MSKMKLVVIVIWMYFVGSALIHGTSSPTIATHPPSFPWQIIFSPIIIIVGAYFSHDLPGEFFLGRKVDQQFGLGTYRKFMRQLRPELLFAAVCSCIGMAGLVRIFLLRIPAQPIEVCGFFVSGGVAFAIAHLIRVQRQKLSAPLIDPGTALSTFSQDSSGFWSEAKRRRDICWLVFPGWLLAGPLLFGIYSLIIPQASQEARGIGALLTWGAVMIWSQTRLKQMRCYQCGKQAFGNAMFFWSHARCRHCGASPKDSDVALP